MMIATAVAAAAVKSATAGRARRPPPLSTRSSGFGRGPLEEMSTIAAAVFAQSMSASLLQPLLHPS